jgi:4'-phosphopantetheinyl transferase EntD
VAIETRFVRRLPFGTCVGVSLPAHSMDDAALTTAAAALHPDELAFARTLPSLRRVTWVGGRIALRTALREIGRAPDGPVYATARGAPALPPELGAVASISHKRTLAVALAAPTAEPDAFTLGVDVEDVRPLKQDIARHVLTAFERASLPAAGPARDADVLWWFAAKESIYKALDPWVGRFVSFQEAEVVRAPGGGWCVRLMLAGGEGPFAVELHDASEPGSGLILVAARIRRPPS